MSTTTKAETTAPAEETKTETTAPAGFNAEAFAGIIGQAVAEGIAAANAKATGPQTITLPVTAPKDTSDRIVLMYGREALEVPRDSADILQAMGWKRAGKDAPTPGTVTLTLPGFDGDPVVVPLSQVGALQAAGWVIKD